MGMKVKTEIFSIVNFPGFGLVGLLSGLVLVQVLLLLK
jgi:hypothetical protein